jgi:hypothetical protein
METFIDASKEVGLEINIEKTKYMLLSRHQNVGRNRDIKIANRSFGNVSQFKHPPRLEYSNYTWRRVQITKLLVMQFSPFFRHLIALRSSQTPLVYVPHL